MINKDKGAYVAQLLKSIVEGVQEKKADEVVCMDLTKIHEAFSDYFVICHANSSTQVRAIAESVEEFVEKEMDEVPLRKEGLMHGEWVLLDYGEVMVHVFKPEKREFYSLEELWGDAPIQRYS